MQVVASDPGHAGQSQQGSRRMQRRWPLATVAVLGALLCWRDRRRLPDSRPAVGVGPGPRS